MSGYVTAFGDRFLRMRDIGVAMAVLEPSGQLVSATNSALQLLERFDLPTEFPAPLPGQLATEIASAPLGEAIMWRHPSTEVGAVLGCTRYTLGRDHLLLLMREITEQQRALSQRLHRQRLEATGRLISHIAHDLRAPLSSIVYNADVLSRTDLPGCNELLLNIQVAAEALRNTVAGLLDFVRIGPPVMALLPLRKVFERVSSLLRPAFRAGNHELSIWLHDDKVCLRGNPIAVEQIFVNLLVNATESRPERVHVRVRSEPAAAGATGPWRTMDRDIVIVRVSDDGPGIPRDTRQRVFEPFMTSKPNGTGLGLTVAREAAVALGGSLTLDDDPLSSGASFTVALPVVPSDEEAAP
jgi:signal transduction histidine kinase